MTSRTVLGAIGLAMGAMVLLAALPSEVLAEQRCSRRDRAEARQHKRAGIRLMGTDPAGAARELEAANELCPDPWYLGSLAVCYQELGRIRDAMAALDAYLETPGVAQRDDAVEARARLEDLLAVVEITSEPPGAAVTLDGEAPDEGGTTPARLELDPGDYVIEVALADHEAERHEVSLEPGEQRRLDLELTPIGGAEEPPVDEPPPPPEEPDDPFPGLDWTGAVQASFGGSLPLASDQLQPLYGFGVNLGGGVDLGVALVELIAELWVSPAGDGYILEASAGPRAGLRLGALPLALEVEALVGLCLTEVQKEQRQIPEGQYYSMAVILGLSLSWRALDWLEVVARPARFELLGLVGDLPLGSAYRWGFDVGLRFRL